MSRRLRSDRTWHAAAEVVNRGAAPRWVDRAPNQRVVGCSQALDWTTLTELTFEAPDYRRFGALKLAYDVIRAGGTAGAVFNAANEQAVAAFLEGRIRFGRIVELVAEALDELAPTSADSLEAVLAADRLARDFVKRQIDA